MLNNQTKNSEDLARNYRRRQLIDATIASIAEHGLSKITLAKVASAAQLSPGIVNFYFKSKEQLLLETLKEMAQEFDSHMQTTIATSKSPEETLLGLIDAFFDPAVFNVRKAAVWSAFWGESRAREDYLKICGQKDKEFYDAIHNLFDRLCVQAGMSDFHTHAAAKGFEGLLERYWQELLCSPDTFDRSNAQRTCRGYLQNLYPNRFEEAAVIPSETAIRTLMAPWTYMNKEFFELEVDRIFKQNWLLVGHISELQNPGDFMTFDAVNERAIVVRGMDRQLRAFHNVCRHRGSRVVRDTKGNCRRAMVCPFHGWTYNLDGSLKNIPAAKTFSKLDKEDHGLVPLDLEVWHGFVFIRFGGNANSVNVQLKSIEEKIAPYQLENVQPLSPEFREVRSVNWKVFHDIDNEGYHVPIGHPGLHGLFGNNYFDSAVGGTGYSYGHIQDKPAKQWSVAKYQKVLPRYDHLPEENQRLWFYVGLFPNAVFEFHPDCLGYYMTLPIAPNKTLYLERYFALPDPRPEAKAAQYLSKRINDRVGFEDESFVNWVQEGLQSSVFPKGILSSIETGVSAFHQEIQMRLPVGRLDKEPAAGTVAQLNDSLHQG